MLKSVFKSKNTFNSNSGDGDHTDLFKKSCESETDSEDENWQFDEIDFFTKSSPAALDTGAEAYTNSNSNSDDCKTDPHQLVQAQSTSNNIRITVFVHSAEFGLVQYTVRGHSSVKALKGEISKKTGVACERMVLRFRKAVLPDSSALSSCHIKNSSVLMLDVYEHAEQLLLHLKLKSGHTHELVLLCGDTVAKLVSRVRVSFPNEFGDSPLVCTYTTADTNDIVELDSGATFISYGFRHSQHILITDEPPHVLVTVKTLTGRGVTFSVPLKNTVHKLKHMVRDEMGIPVEQQRLIFAGKQLHNERLLSSYTAKDLVTVHLVTRMRGGDGNPQPLPTDITDSEIQIVVGCQHQNKTAFRINRGWQVKRLRDALIESELIPSLSASNAPHFVYAGRYLHETRTLQSYKLPQNGAVVVLIPSNKDGNVLKFMSWLRLQQQEEEEEVGDGITISPPQFSLEQLQDSLLAIDSLDSAKLAQEITKGQAVIEQACQQNQNKTDNVYQSVDRAALMAVFLWTTNLLYRLVNRALQSGDIRTLEPWKPFLRTFDSALRHLPYELNTEVYRGTGIKQDISGYTAGSVISFRRIAAFSKDKDRALHFMFRRKAPRVLFVAQSIDGRYIRQLSRYPVEEEVLFAPFAHFRIESVAVQNGGDAEDKEYILVRMKQLQVPTGVKMIVWVDDQPGNNLRWIQMLERKRICVIVCSSTPEAVSTLQSFSWMLMLRHADVRIVTDMRRYNNRTAGIDLVKELRTQFLFHRKVLIFCGKVERAKKYCCDNGIAENVYVTSKPSVLEKYISYQTIDQQYAANSAN